MDEYLNKTFLSEKIVARYYNNRINAIMSFPFYAKYYMETSLRIRSTPRYIELQKEGITRMGTSNE
ncbi:MAG: hypothetical protein ACOX0R_02160 [Candidatus Dojkabacteria bacterium]|jgi:hypothetical protein